MDSYLQLRQLLELAEAVGIEVRRAPESGESDAHPGGALVRLRGREVLFLDLSSSVGDRVAVVAAALRGRPELETMFLPPEIRQIIDGNA